MNLTHTLNITSPLHEHTTASLLSLHADLDVPCPNHTNRKCWAEEEAAVMSRAAVTSLAAILVCVCACSVVANSLVCLVFSRQRGDGGGGGLSVSNRFLVNLAACNALFTLLVLPLALPALLTGRWLWGRAVCQASGLAGGVLVTASTLTLAAISLDRYLAVLAPLRYTLRVTPRRCAAVIAAIWAASVAVSLPPLLGWSRFKFHASQLICTVAWDSPRRADRGYTLFLVTLTFLLPLGAMLWTYARIFRAARDNSQRTRRSSVVPPFLQAEHEASQCATPVSERRRGSSVPILRRLSQGSCGGWVGVMAGGREEWRTAVTSFLILATFTLGWLPHCLVLVLPALLPALPLPPLLPPLSTLTALLACACNPLVYVFRSKATRRRLARILTRRRRLRHHVFSTATRGRGGGGEGGRVGGGGKGERVEGSVLWQEREREGGGVCGGECHAKLEEGSVPCGKDCGNECGKDCGKERGKDCGKDCGKYCGKECGGSTP
ncbi:hypothetical protein ACOMHN_042850 [Nucella lapillus]